MKLCVSTDCPAHGVGSKRAREVVALAAASLPVIDVTAAPKKKKQKTTAEKKAEMTKDTLRVPFSSSPTKKKVKPVHKDDLLGAPSEFQKSVMKFMRMHGI
jgi:hypothetical protein